MIIEVSTFDIKRSKNKNKNEETCYTASLQMWCVGEIIQTLRTWGSLMFSLCIVEMESNTRGALGSLKSCIINLCHITNAHKISVLISTAYVYWRQARRWGNFAIADRTGLWRMHAAHVNVGWVLTVNTIKYNYSLGATPSTQSSSSCQGTKPSRFIEQFSARMNTKLKREPIDFARTLGM